MFASRNLSGSFQDFLERWNYACLKWAHVLMGNTENIMTFHCSSGWFLGCFWAAGKLDGTIDAANIKVRQRG